jgi:hypothetical protein
MTTHDKSHDALRRFVNATTASKTPRDAHELVLVASGEPDALWRADKEQVDSFRADELATELQTIASTHADARSTSIRFFARWLSADGRILVAHSWRTGEGALVPMDGSSESVIMQMQRLVETSLRTASEQNTEAINALKYVTKTLIDEGELLRAELRVRRDTELEGKAPTESDGETKQKYGSHTERVVSNLLEKAGTKYIERAFTENAGVSNDNGQKPESD